MSMSNEFATLQDLLDSTRDLVDYFYNETLAPHFRTRTGLAKVYVPAEFTNWRDEQRAWQNAAILFDQSHHMPELFLEGPDALKLLAKIGINSFGNFTLDRAKQFVACTPRGHIIGDCIAYRNGENSYELVSGMGVLNWVHYHAETGGYDVTVTRDNTTAFNPTGRRVRYRFQIDGPMAGKVFAAAIDGEAPNIPFFKTATVKISGREVLVLRHGMAGHQGAELSGPYDDMETVRAALLEAGKPYGILQGGTKAYFSTLFESGWMAYPIAAIFTGEDLRAFREWLPANGWEANTQLGGSFYSDNIEDYYVTPWNLGYDRIMKFDHDFIGREALEAMAQKPQRRRVRLEWNREDVARVFASQFGDGPRFKAMEFPVVYYGFPHFDEVRSQNGALVGLSCHCGYTENLGEMVSLAMLDEHFTAEGTELLLTWGEPDGGSRKPHVERHEQTTIRVTVISTYAQGVEKTKFAPITA